MLRTQSVCLRKRDHGQRLEARSWTCILLRHLDACSLARMESIATIRRGKSGRRFCVRMERYLPPGLTAAREAAPDTLRFLTPRPGSGPLALTFQMRITPEITLQLYCRMGMYWSKVRSVLICGTGQLLPRRWPHSGSLMMLPTGQVLVGGTQVYDPAGTYEAAWAPTITTAPSSVNRGSTYKISGTQFNGLSQAAAFGDEYQTATNYPLVRITNTATGHVFYAKHTTTARWEWRRTGERINEVRRAEDDGNRRQHDGSCGERNSIAAGEHHGELKEVRLETSPGLGRGFFLCSRACGRNGRAGRISESDED